MRRRLWRAVVVCAGVILACSAEAQVSVDGYGGAKISLFSSGQWTVSTASPSWVFGGSIQTAAAGIVARTGSDGAGTFEEIDYTATGSTGFIRAYTGTPAILFSATLTRQTSNPVTLTAVSKYPANPLRLSYAGEFSLPSFTSRAADSPWIFFDASANTFIVSPASNYMIAAMRSGAAGEIDSGINKAITALPVGFTHATALVYGRGIDSTIQTWGRLLTAISGKRRPSNQADLLLKQISYWTDNTATYYYNAGPTSYSDTLGAIRDEFTAKGVTLGSVQLDSWWYPKGPDNSWSSHGGIWTYTAAPEHFPDGLASFQSALGRPLAVHARWIDQASPYRSQYAISGNVAIDPSYWETVASYLQTAGVQTYEQDWLGDAAHANVNLTDPPLFMDSMAAAMARHGITMQYCMAEPKHFLQSTLYNNATTVRTSQDGFTNARWTQFLYSGRFASAVGLWPFTDVFKSADTQNTILAVLSAGPVGLGDALGSLSRPNLLKAARADGVLVKPDTAIAPLDSVYVADAQGQDAPMIASAATDYGNGTVAHFIFAYTRQTNDSITITPGDFGISGDSYLYDDLNGAGVRIAAGASWSGTLAGASRYFILVPVGKTGIAFLGDAGHFATLGKQRIASVADDGRLDVQVSFAPGERARTLIGYSPQPVTVTSLAGMAGPPLWDPTTQRFTVAVHPSPKMTARVRIVESFLGESQPGASIACGRHCIAPPAPAQ